MRLTGETLAAQRRSIGATQDEMAKRAGVKRQTIGFYEKEVPGKIADILDAYCLEVYPTIGLIPADIRDVERVVKKIVRNNLGVKCNVKLSIELLGADDENV